MSKQPVLFALFAVCACALGGCVNDPIAVAATQNPQIPVELLFTHRGCRIYRFRDPAPVYYADCRGAGGEAPGSASTSWRVSCGRNCSRPVMATTAQ